MTGGIGIPLPLVSPGPSREQRRRDSIVDGDNRARLKRLLERARGEGYARHNEDPLTSPSAD